MWSCPPRIPPGGGAFCGSIERLDRRQSAKRNARYQWRHRTGVVVVPQQRVDPRTSANRIRVRGPWPSIRLWTCNRARLRAGFAPRPRVWACSRRPSTHASAGPGVSDIPLTKNWSPRALAQWKTRGQAVFYSDGKRDDSDATLPVPTFLRMLRRTPFPTLLITLWVARCSGRSRRCASARASQNLAFRTSGG